MKHVFSQHGQVLTSLLYFVVVAVIVTSAAVAVIVVNANASNATQEGAVALGIAESGVENALLRLLRDPEYRGETLTVGDGLAVVTLSGNDPITVDSKGSVGGFTRQIEAHVSYVNNKLFVTSWKEL